MCCIDIGDDGEEGNEGPREEPQSSFQEQFEVQFQQQHDTVEELKVILLRNEDNLMNRQKEAEVRITI